MSKQATNVIDVDKFTKGLRSFAKANVLFLNTAWAAHSTFTGEALKADSQPTKRFAAHIQSFREVLMSKDEGSPRQVWDETGAGSDGSYRGYVTHMCHAIVGIARLGEDAEAATFKALCAAGKPPAKQPGGKDAKDGEDTLGDLLAKAESLLKRAPRKDPSKWDCEATQFLGEFIAALAEGGDE